MSFHEIIINIFRVLASCTSTMMILSPAPSVYRIFKTQKTGHLSIFPLISVVFNCHTWMLYGYLEEIFFPVFTTFAIGTVIALCYVAIFYRWTQNRDKANRLLRLFGCALFAATMYAVIGGFGLTGQSRLEAAQYAGYIAISSSLVLYTSPLEKIRLVFQNKSATFIPIQMVIAGSTNNLMWIIYTSLTGKWLMFVPNVFTLSVGLFQIVLYFFVYHPATHPYVDETKERRSTATTDENEDEHEDEHEDAQPASLGSEDHDMESGNYVTIQTPTAAMVTPEVQI